MTKFMHRIDAVPAIGSRVEFYYGEEPHRFATVVEPSDTYWRGVGDDVRFMTDDGQVLIPTKVMSFWRNV